MSSVIDNNFIENTFWGELPTEKETGDYSRFIGKRFEVQGFAAPMAVFNLIRLTKLDRGTLAITTHILDQFKQNINELYKIDPKKWDQFSTRTRAKLDTETRTNFLKFFTASSFIAQAYQDDVPYAFKDFTKTIDVEQEEIKKTYTYVLNKLGFVVAPKGEETKIKMLYMENILFTKPIKTLDASFSEIKLDDGDHPD